MTDTLKVRVLVAYQIKNKENHGTGWDRKLETIVGYLSYGKCQLDLHGEAEDVYGFFLSNPLYGGTAESPLFEPKLIEIANRAMIFEGWGYVSNNELRYINNPSMRQCVKANKHPCRWSIFPMESSGINLGLSGDAAE